MKKKYKTLVERLLLFVGMVLIAVILQGKNIQAEASETAINVLDYGACGTDTESDRNALNEALRAAGAVSDGRRTEVYVPPGTYYLDGYIGIFSNTWLHLSDDAKIVRMDGYETESMLIGIHNNDDGNVCWENCTHTGYLQCVNVLISGGEWSGGSDPDDALINEPSLEIMSFRHGHTIEIRDTTLGDTSGYHVINLDGVKDVMIDNVYVHDHLRNSTDISDEDVKCREAIHTDIITNDAEYSSAYPLEELACADVVIRNCRFRNCKSCIGTHNGCDGLYTEGFTVENCTFEDIEFHCINAVNFFDMQIYGNEAKNVSSFISAYGCKGENIISGNKISCESHTQLESCIDLCKGTEASVQDNIIQNAGSFAISAANFGDDTNGSCYLYANNNEITDPGNAGIYIRDGAGAMISGNRIESSNGGNADRTLGIFFNTTQQNCIADGNVIVGFEYGIEAANSTQIELINNTIRNADVYGISLYIATANIQNCTVENCTVGLQIDQSKAEIANVQLDANEDEINAIHGSDVSGLEEKNADGEEVKKSGSSPDGDGQAESGKSEEKSEDEKDSSTIRKSVNNTGKKTVKTSAVPVYRVFNPNSGEHFYTVNKGEKNWLVRLGWHDEGIGWYAPKSSKTPVYRLYNPNGGDHFYTVNKEEKNWLSKLGWRYEGIGWYSDDNKGSAVYRHYHPKQKTGYHHYTTSKMESGYIVLCEGWRYEGIGWYGTT